MPRFVGKRGTQQADQFILTELYGCNGFYIRLHLFDIGFRLLRASRREKALNGSQMMPYVMLIDRRLGIDPAQSFCLCSSLLQFNFQHRPLQFSLGSFLHLPMVGRQKNHIKDDEGSRQKLHQCRCAAIQCI